MWTGGCLRGARLPAAKAPTAERLSLLHVPLPLTRIFCPSKMPSKFLPPCTWAFKTPSSIYLTQMLCRPRVPVYEAEDDSARLNACNSPLDVLHAFMARLQYIVCLHQMVQTLRGSLSPRSFFINI